VFVFKGRKRGEVGFDLKTSMGRREKEEALVVEEKIGTGGAQREVWVQEPGSGIGLVGRAH